MPIDYTRLPYHMRDGMQLYIEEGIVPGSFLRAVLSNDLMGALGKADDINQAILPVYGRFLYNDAPCGCYGSPETVAAWCNSGGLNGIAAADEVAL
jgi:hypothetical protein